MDMHKIYKLLDIFFYHVMETSLTDCITVWQAASVLDHLNLIWKNQKKNMEIKVQ